MPKLGMEVIRRRQVIDAVLTILATQGWRDLTIREISDVAGVSAGVITHYFANKRTMVIDAIADAHRQLIQALNAIEKKAAAPVRLLSVVDILLLSTPANLPSRNFWLAIIGRMPFDRIIQAEVQKFQLQYVEFIAHIVEQGIARGEFRASRSADDIATSLLALSTGLAIAAVATPTEMSAERQRRLMIETLAFDLGMALDAKKTGGRAKAAG